MLRGGLGEVAQRSVSRAVKWFGLRQTNLYKQRQKKSPLFERPKKKEDTMLRD